LDDPAHGQPLPDHRPMQINQGQFRLLYPALTKGVLIVQEEVTEVIIAMADPIAVKCAAYRGELAQQAQLGDEKGGLLRPVSTIVLKADGILNRLGKNEGLPSGRIEPATSETHRGHRLHAELIEAPDGTPFVVRSQHRHLQHHQVLQYFAPADSVMNLGKVVAILEGELQGAP